MTEPRNAVNIRTSQLRVDLSIIGRKQLSEDAVERYMDLIESGRKKPILVQEGSNLVVDGAHRLEAYKRLNKQWIPCEVHDISYEDLRLVAYRCNKEHGVQYTGEENDEIIFNLYTKDGKTQKEIADETNLSPSTVHRILKKMFSVLQTQNAKSFDKRRKLEPGTKQIIAKLLAQGEKQKDIADMFSITRSRVSQIKKELEKEREAQSRRINVGRSIAWRGEHGTVLTTAVDEREAQKKDNRRLKIVQNLHDRVERLEADWCLKTWDTGKLHRIYLLINSIIPHLGGVSVRIWRKVKENSEIDFGLDEYTTAIEEHGKLREKVKGLERTLKTPETELKEEVGGLIKDGGKTSTELIAWADENEIERRRMACVLKGLIRENMVCRDGERYVTVI